MATINTNQYFDDNPRTAGEAWTINDGAELTIRTDTRWHANSPASMTGTIGAMTINDGKIIIDATKVRWLAYNNGTGNVPAVGTTITQGDTTGYLLGVWTDLTSAPSAVGSSMPASGYIKFREVEGAFAAGSLDGIGATATGADVAGWIEVVLEQSAITIPRLGEFKTRGDWFYLPQLTDGTIGQVIQIPTNNGGSGTRSPGLWIETSPGSDEYAFWSAIYPTTSGNWHIENLGYPLGGSDIRGRFVKDIGNGQMQIGEGVDVSGTYEALSMSGTYSTVSQSCTYEWADDKITVTYNSGHLLKQGDNIYLNFTSGDATSKSGYYTVDILSPYEYQVDVAGSGAGGNVTAIVATAITISGNYLGNRENVYCNFTSGGATSGAYKIKAILSSSVFWVDYIPSSSKSGNVTVWAEYRIFAGTPHYVWAGQQVYLDFTSGSGVDGIYTLTRPLSITEYTGAATYTWASNVVTITLSNHGKVVGDTVYLDFTSGGATAYDGNYTVVSVPNSSTFTVALTGSGTGGNVTYYSTSFRVNAHNNGAADSGNVTIKRVIGHIPEAGCKIRIPNIIMRDATSGARASNYVNPTITSRGRFVTTASGKVDMEYAYTTWHTIFSQAFECKISNSATLDRWYFEKLSEPIYLDNLGIGYNIGTNLNSLYCWSVNGGIVKNSVFYRAGSSGAHSCNVRAIYDLTFKNVLFGNLLKATKSSYNPLNLAASNNITIEDCKVINGHMYLSACNTVRVKNLDMSYVVNGKNNSFYASYGAHASTSTDVVYDGLTFGFNGLIQDVGARTSIATAANCTNVVFKNFGTRDNPLVPNRFRTNYYGLAYIPFSPGYNVGVKYHNINIDEVCGSPIHPNNNDKDVVYSNISCGYYYESLYALNSNNNLTINSVVRGCAIGATPTVGQASVYGTHFGDHFLGRYRGALYLQFNEPTPQTINQFTVLSGNPRFNSLGGLLMYNVGDSIIFEDSIYRIGHTGFHNSDPVMSGGTISDYSIDFDIDTGNGYSGSWQTLNGTNLSAITIDPNVGFKIKYRITTINANTTPITYLTIRTTTTPTAQKILYKDTYTITITGIDDGAKVALVSAGTETLIDKIQTASGGNAVLTYSESDVGNYADIKILKAGKIPYIIENVELKAENSEIPVSLEDDYCYDSAADANCSFAPNSKIIELDSGTTSVSVKGLYKKWIDWALTDENLKYKNAFFAVGGQTIDNTLGTSVPVYVYLANNWKIKPQEANHTLTVADGIILTSDGSDPFVNTTGSYNVKILYQQPVNAIGVIDQSRLASAVWDSIKTNHSNAGTFGAHVAKSLATKGDLQV